MEKELLSLLAKISDYANKRGIVEGIELTLDSDGSGGALDYATQVEIFSFNSIAELLQILDEVDVSNLKD